MRSDPEPGSKVRAEGQKVDGNGTGLRFGDTRLVIFTELGLVDDSHGRSYSTREEIRRPGC